ncbi:MAG: glucokinase [Verrucomicrobiales bacterium]|jgi:glucokinase
MSKKSNKSKGYSAGLDIGGTTIKAMLVDSAGDQVGELVEVQSRVDEGYTKTFGQLKEALGAILKGGGLGMDDLAVIGLDVPAPCSNGVIWGKANLSPDWVGTNIREAFSAMIGKPVFMTNDGNAAAFGEFLMRPNLKSGLLFVAPGTGLAGGLVLPGGYMYEGANGLAMEIGAIAVPFREGSKLPEDANGREGSLEAWVSLIAIRRQLEAKLKSKRYQSHPLNQGNLTIKEKAFKLRDFAEEGDGLALEIFRKQAQVLGFALGDQCSELDPGMIVIGGGLAETKFRDWYLQEVRRGFQRRASPFYQQSPIPPHEPTTRFEWAIGGDAAAAFGVARKAMLELA